MAKSSLGELYSFRSIKEKIFYITHFKKGKLDNILGRICYVSLPPTN